MSEVILITSGKGGAGKTMFAANIGVSLAKKGHKTIVVDLDMGMRNLDLYMGYESRAIYNVADVLAGTCKVNRAVITDTKIPELSFMAAPPSKEGIDISPVHIEVLCKRLRTEFEYIILDTPTGIGAGGGLELAISSSDCAILMVEPDIASVRGGEAVDAFLRDAGVARRYLLINKIRPDLMEDGLVPPLSESVRNLRVPLLGGIQYDDNILVFTGRGIPIVKKEGTYIQENFANIADKIIAMSGK